MNYLFRIAAAVVLLIATAFPLFGLWRDVLTPAPVGDSAAFDQTADADASLMRDEWRAILKREPLATTPFLDASRDSSMTLSTAIALTEQGLARSPRSVALLQRRFELAESLSDFETMISTLDRLYTLDPENRHSYINAMVLLSYYPEARAAILEHLANEPNWAGYFINALRDEKADPGFMFEAIKLTGKSKSAVIDRLIKENDFDRAFIVWLELLSLDGETFTGWPHNPIFKQEERIAPFNWWLGQLTDFEQPSGLRAVFKGRDRPVLLRQHMLLEPGRYRFWMRAKGKTKPRGGHFSWEIHCLDRKPATKTKMMIETLSSDDEVQVFDFELPMDACSVQRLELRGEADEFPFSAWIEIDAVGIDMIALMDAEQ